MLLEFKAFDPQMTGGRGETIWVNPLKVYAVREPAGSAAGSDLGQQMIVHTARIHVAPGDSVLVVDEPQGSVAADIDSVQEDYQA